MGRGLEWWTTGPGGAVKVAEGDDYFTITPAEMARRRALMIDGIERVIDGIERLRAVAQAARALGDRAIIELSEGDDEARAAWHYVGAIMRELGLGAAVEALEPGDLEEADSNGRD